MERANTQKRKKTDGKPTKLRIFVLAFAGALFVAMIGVTIRHGLHDFAAASLPLLLSNLALWLIPFACHLWLRRAVSDAALLILELFLFFASFLGSCVRLYDLVFWYDSFVHTAVGYLAALLGLFLLCKLSRAEQQKTALIVLVCVAVSLAVAAIWEMYEFLTDALLSGTAQGTPVETVDGAFVTPVYDTMKDILCNTGGAVAFALHYLLHVWLKKDLGIGWLMRDFTAGKPLADKEGEQTCPSCNTNANNAENDSKNL